MLQRLIYLPEPGHKTANGISFEHPFSLALLQCRKPVLCGFVTLNESVITNEVGFLILSNGTVLIDTPLNESGNDLSLLEKVTNFRVQVSTACQCRLYQTAVLNQAFTVWKQAVEDIEESGLNGVLCQMRCLAALCAIEFIIALPDRAAVFVCRVPDLGAEELAAVTADDFTGENTAASVTPSEFLASGQFLLHPVKKLRRDENRELIIC